MSRTLICKESDTIDSTVEEVWSILSAFGSIKAWMPTIDSCTTDGIQVGAIRTVYSGGNALKEQLQVWDPKTHTVSYRMLDPTGMPAKGAFGTVSLEAKGEKSTGITWVADAEEVDEESAKVMGGVFTPFIKKSIGGLKSTLAREAEPLF